MNEPFRADFKMNQGSEPYMNNHEHDDAKMKAHSSGNH